MSWESIFHEKRLCWKPVYWWDGEYEGNCERDPEHEGDHFDGLSWYTDEGEFGEEDPGYDISAGPHARYWREREKETG